MRKKVKSLVGGTIILILLVVLMPFLAIGAEKRQTPTAPEDYLKMQNPFSLKDKKAIERGETLYTRKCKKCHGEKGDGKGEDATDLNPPVKSFIDPEYNLAKKPDGQLFWIMEKGSKNTDMEAFGPGTETDISKEDLWKIVTFIRFKFQK